MTGTLYTGSDLRNAATHSTVAGNFADSLLGVRNAVGVLGDIARYRGNHAERPGFELTRMTGAASAGGGQLTVVYAGHGANRDWCLSTVFDQHHEAETRRFPDSHGLATELRHAADESNIVFAEGLSGSELSLALPCSLTLPTWVRQRVSTTRRWQDLVDGLRRGTRQEIARMLRKYEYGCRLTLDPGQFDHFFEHLYKPHIVHRHGEAALIVDRERFLRECRRGVVLQLLRKDSVVAAALLRQIGRTMAVIWCGIGHEAGAANLRGTTDILDYFSLLYANLKGCRWLDFGRSRPDLTDGLLRYKRKWGAELTAGFVPQTTLAMTCNGRSDTERGFLQRHAFLCRRRRRFRTLLFIDGDMHAEALERSLRSLITPGVAEYRIIALSPLSPDLRNAIDRLPRPVSLVVAESMHAAIRAAGH